MSCYNSTVPSSSPQNVTVESVNPASLMVSWRPPVIKDRNGPITGYLIQYTRVGLNDMSMNVTSEIETVLRRLDPYVNYSVIVAAMTVNGTGTFSDPPVVGRSGEDGELTKLITLLVVCVFLCVTSGISLLKISKLNILDDVARAYYFDVH